MAAQENTKYQWFTPFNIITGIVLFVGLILTILRFTQGIGAVTNLDNNNPWGMVRYEHEI